MESTIHVYEVHPRKDKRGVNLISDVPPFGRLWYDTPDHAIGYAMHSSRSHDAVIRVYDTAGNSLPFVVDKLTITGTLKASDKQRQSTYRAKDRGC
jgi:hypothetical protein